MWLPVAISSIWNVLKERSIETPQNTPNHPKHPKPPSKTPKPLLCDRVGLDRDGLGVLKWPVVGLG